MCGIAGYFGRRSIDDRTIRATLALMERRGPDARAHRHFVSPTGRHVHLLHSRLKILDLDPRANQPFVIGDHHMVYNGELYNFVEVKKDLEARGLRFTTTSDTEVLLQAIAEGGKQALDACEGMWAFAVYDSKEGTLLLSRDRFGEKPLYLFTTEDGLYFGSEIKLIAALAERRLEVDLEHVRRYLVNGYKALYKKGQGFFKGVSELQPGSVLELDASGRETRTKYWTFSQEEDRSMSYEDAVSGTRRRLVRSVELRLRADVPLAFCMSGGIDSNALISIAKRVLGYDVHGFTIENSDPRYNETELVDASKRALGIRHTPIPTDTKNFLGNLRALVRYHDAPVYTISYYAHWLLMQSIKAHGYRIAVSGTAADELYTGYYDHHLAYLAEVKSDPAIYSPALAGWAQHVREIVRNPFLSDPDLFVRDPSFRDHIYLDADGFAAYLTTPFHEPFEERAFTKSLLRNRMLNELFHEAVPVILHEDDLNAMYHSIENRSPLLDRALFEHSLRIPTRHLMRDGFAKVVLRDAMRGIVPDPVLDSRRKVGFNAPIMDFLDPQDPEVRSDLLAQSPIFDLVRRDKIEALLARRDLPNSQSKFLFYFLCSKMFLEEYGA